MQDKLKQIITDLEAIIAYQNSLIFNLENTIEAQNYRMWWYTDFINDYDGQLLEVGKVLDKTTKKDIVKPRGSILREKTKKEIQESPKNECGYK